MRIRTLLTAAVLIAVAGCNADGSTGGTALPVGESSAPSTAAAPTTTAAPTHAAPPASPSAPAASRSAAPSPTPSPTTETPVGTRCHSSQLSASFGPQDAGAGQRYATIVLGNRSGRTCTVYGYGGMQPLDSAKKQLPVTLTRDRSRRPVPVRLAPGAQVSKVIHWTVVPSGAQECPRPAYAAVTPPDETDPIVIAWPFEEVCGGRIDGFPYGATV
jgi:hypothetical protein